MGDETVVQKNKFVTFKSGNEYFGIDIQYVNEIIVFQEITKVPESEDYIKGLINLRGKIIPVIDIRIRFKQEPFEYNDRTCIIIVKVKNTTVGLIVEKIAEVVEISSDNIIPSPSLAKVETPQNRYVYAIGKVGDDVKLLLDPDRILNDDIISTLEGEEETTDEEAVVEEVSVNKKDAVNTENKPKEVKADDKKQNGEKPKEETPIFFENPMLKSGTPKLKEENADVTAKTEKGQKKDKKDDKEKGDKN